MQQRNRWSVPENPEVESGSRAWLAGAGRKFRKSEPAVENHDRIIGG
jgi:hypothetical protein